MGVFGYERRHVLYVLTLERQNLAQRAGTPKYWGQVVMVFLSPKGREKK
jgi:hypothetical protein